MRLSYWDDWSILSWKCQNGNPVISLFNHRFTVPEAAETHGWCKRSAAILWLVYTSRNAGHSHNRAVSFGVMPNYVNGSEAFPDVTSISDTLASILIFYFKNKKQHNS